MKNYAYEVADSPIASLVWGVICLVVFLGLTVAVYLENRITATLYLGAPLVLLSVWMIMRGIQGLRRH